MIPEVHIVSYWTLAVAQFIQNQIYSCLIKQKIHQFSKIAITNGYQIVVLLKKPG